MKNIENIKIQKTFWNCKHEYVAVDLQRQKVVKTSFYPRVKNKDWIYYKYNPYTLVCEVGEGDWGLLIGPIIRAVTERMAAEIKRRKLLRVTENLYTRRESKLVVFVGCYRRLALQDITPKSLEENYTP